MELLRENNNWYNSYKEIVDVEDEYIYPLIKGSEINNNSGKIKIKRAVIVPQKKLGEKTSALAHIAPKLWGYLMAHNEVFDSRKSSIYKNKPPFSVFGIGDYSFSKYKVAVSGLHKKPRFLSLGPFEKKPVFCDDTCYILPCVSALQAAIICALLNHPMTIKFLNSIMFKEAKRPVTKAVLSRIDLIKLAEALTEEDLKRDIRFNLEIMNCDKATQKSGNADLLGAIGLKNSKKQLSLF